AQGLANDRAAAENVRFELLVLWAWLEFVEPFKNALLRAFGHGRHDVVLVVKREVIENIFSLNKHPSHALDNNRSQLETERRVVSQQRWQSTRENQALAVLMLESFTVQGGAPGGCAEEET